MPRFTDIVERVANAPVVPSRLPLVALLTGFTDAGGAVASTVEYMREELDPQPVAVFRNDALLDYRARRPILTFDRDHISEIRAPRLELSLVRDALGQPFLLLSGYEPDYAWEAFVDAVRDLADAFDVASFTWAHAIAMPVPHTRPLTTTVSGSREELIRAHSAWKPTTQAPATIGHLLELRLSEDGYPVTGFVALVPHYLAETEYPATAQLVLDRFMATTGRVFDLDRVRESNGEFVARIDEQIAQNEELARMVSVLEGRYDAYMAGERDHAGQDVIGDLDEGDLPSADELAAELERYLASRPADDDKQGGSPF